MKMISSLLVIFILTIYVNKDKCMSVTRTDILHLRPYVLTIQSCTTVYSKNYSGARPHPQNQWYRFSHQNQSLNQSETSPPDRFIRDCLWPQRTRSTIITAMFKQQCVYCPCPPHHHFSTHSVLPSPPYTPQ